MMSFVLGISLAANAFLLFLLVVTLLALKKTQEKQQAENPYAELEELIHGSEWDRINDTNPPPRTGVEAASLLRTVGKKPNIPKR